MYLKSPESVNGILRAQPPIIWQFCKILFSGCNQVVLYGVMLRYCVLCSKNSTFRRLTQTKNSTFWVLQ